ncbi:MAG: zinc-dependent metalloprotease, partial [Longimicrobiales bacterium]
TATSDPAAAQAVELTFGPSVLQSAKIASIRDDGALVVPVYDWFVSDLSNVGERVERAADGNAEFDEDRSFIESVKSFPANTNVRSRLTFRPAEPPDATSLPDNRSISISIHYTLAALPEVPMTTRAGDDRVGNFWTVHKDFSSLDSTFFVRYVNRWRLEPGERVGDLWRPKEPITYYIGPTVPEEYRAVFKEGVEAWNAAFEAAGFVDAIRALDLPQDAYAEDIRYATLRWNVSDESGYGAIGPSVVDPRTGEVLDADILFEASMFQGHRRSWRTLAGQTTAAEALEQTLGVGADPVRTANGSELAGFADAFIEQGALLATSLAARGEIGPNDPVPDEFLMQAAKWVVMHEVGHTLGLQHNFRSSASTPFDRLHDRAWAEQNGVFSSVMEYPTVNIAPPGQTNGYYYNPGIGSYDRWAISYAYSPDPARAAELAREAADPRHLYGTNAESGGAGALDPSINTYDLSADPLAWGAERAGIIAGLWPRLPEYTLDDNAGYYELTAAFQSLLREYARALAPAVKYIGGQYINRDHVGDPNGRLPFENVPLAEQQEALALIVDRAFDADAFDIPRPVLARLGSNRWLHWGESNTFDGRLDFPFHEEVLDLQASLLDQLLNPSRLARIRDAETKYGQANVVTIPQLMDAVTDAVWSELESAQPGNITAMRRDLQRAYLEDLIALVVEPQEDAPADARAVARAQLTTLGERIEPRLASATSLDAYTRAHLEDVAARIEKALDADLPRAAPEEER